MGLGQGHIGQPLGFKAGFGEGGGFAPPSNLLNANSIIYYDALVVANGGDIDTQTLYSVSLNNFKTYLSDMFNTLEDNGVYAKTKRWTPRLGGIGATQCINASNPGTYDGVYASGTTFSANGTAYDGITGAENTGFNGQLFNSVTDFGFSFWIVTENFIGGGGDVVFSNFPAAASFYVYIDGLDRYLGYMNSVNYVGAAVNTGFYTFTRVGATMTVYRNGVLVDTAMASDSLAFSTDVINMAKYNTTYSEFSENNVLFHDGLDATETLDLYNTINTFNTALGR